MSGAHGLPLKLISCTISSLSMLVDLLTGRRLKVYLRDHYFFDCF